jgi:hypothetical protein
MQNNGVQAPMNGEWPPLGATSQPRNFGGGIAPRRATGEQCSSQAKPCTVGGTRRPGRGEPGGRTWRYRFTDTTRTARYRFRLVVPYDKHLPWKRLTSRQVSVLVRA